MRAINSFIAKLTFQKWIKIFSAYIIYYLAFEIYPFLTTYKLQILAPYYLTQILGLFLILSRQSIQIAMGSLFLIISYVLLLYITPEAIPPHIPIINSFLLAFLFWHLQNPKLKRMPPDLIYFLYFVVGIAHWTAGFTKIIGFDASWINGNAITDIFLTSPWVRKPISDLILTFVPQFFLKFFSWATLILEFCSLYLLIPHRSRRLYLWLLIIMHLSAWITLSLGQVSVGILLCLLFLLASDQSAEVSENE